MVSFGGQTLGEVIVLRDFTAQYRVDRAKSDFIATISHELRTPLTPVRGYLDMLLLPSVAGELTETQRMFVQTIRQHVNSIGGLLNNLIMQASLDAGALDPTLLPCEVEPLVGQALQGLQSEIEAKGLALVMDLPADLPVVLVDSEQVIVALSKIVENAIRYTASGTITIRAARPPSSWRCRSLIPAPASPPMICRACLCASAAPGSSRVWSAASAAWASA